MNGLIFKINFFFQNFKILNQCMNNGRVENFQRPYKMILDETSILFEMLNSLEKGEKERLIEIAKSAAADLPSSADSSTLSPNTYSTSSKLLNTSSSQLTTTTFDMDLSFENDEKLKLLPEN